MGLISAEMAAAVGSVVDWKVSYPVAASDIRRWAIAVHYPDPPPRRFCAETTPGGITAPEEFNPFAWMAAAQREPVVAPELRDTDRMEKAIGIAGPGLRNQVNGGTEVTYGVPIRPGDVIRSETRLVSYAEKTGRMGPMLVSVTESVWTNQDGERVQVERQTALRY
ncbi:MaoC family dehydratase N-terminal domain-containing protein [Yinghuangia sp. ASG 101]|uniref:FAS1-like dehydratase domain-containing protein n=1 Tax=Yinghuangia sp. ASG 101 TaxID=2896848 RepID=UPI001E531988|nr:MaoC family dehydratase N-terminal domain-containing protein [Yinghuangia sp. ASG 101]UGQ11129.1 MaoC family dehydratase N-terminal domain-containing protein [Yinghuangia sp. ASG 101]